MDKNLFVAAQKTDSQSQDEAGASKAVMGLLRRLWIAFTASFLVAASIGYLGIIGVLPAVRAYMEDLPVTQSLLDQIQMYRVQPMTDGKFNVLVADLDGDDASSSGTKHVVRSLEAQFETASATSPIGVQRAHRILTLPNAPDRAIAQQRAVAKGRGQLTRINADLMIWGEVVKSTNSRPVLSLQFLSRESKQENKKESYALGEKLDLPGEFSENLGAALAAEVVADMYATIGKDKHADKVAAPLLTKLRALRRRMPAALAPEQQAIIHASYAGVVHSIGAVKHDMPLLREAVSVYSVALDLIAQSPDGPQGMWLYLNLGRAQSWLGRLEDSVTRIKDSIDSLTKASGIAARLMNWSEQSRINFSLGNAYRNLYLRERDTALLDKSVTAFRNSQSADPGGIHSESWALTGGSLAGVQIIQGEKKYDFELVKEGISGLELASNILIRNNDRMGWARAQHDTGWGYLVLSRLQQDSESAKVALKYLDASLDVFDASVPYFITSTHVSRAHALRLLGTYEKNVAPLNKAKKILTEVLANISQKSAVEIQLRAQKELIRVLLALGRIADKAQQEKFSQAYQLSNRLLKASTNRDYVDLQRMGFRTAEALIYVARCAIYLKKIERADEATKQAIDIASDKPSIRVMRAHSLAAAGRLDAAKEIYHSVVKVPDEGRLSRHEIINDISQFREAGVDVSAFDQVTSDLTGP